LPIVGIFEIIDNGKKLFPAWSSLSHNLRPRLRLEGIVSKPV
jgi:hypothetical protein